MGFYYGKRRKLKIYYHKTFKFGRIKESTNYRKDLETFLKLMYFQIGTLALNITTGKNGLKLTTYKQHLL